MTRYSALKQVLAAAATLGALLSLMPGAQAQHPTYTMSLAELVDANHRRPADIARNDWRNPVETLEFFGLERDMTVIEILPATGWYADIIAPYVADQGKYYAAHFSPNATAAYMPRILRMWEEKVAADPALYGRITTRHLNPPHEVAIAPAESADLALTFRNVHNWIMAGQENEFFDSFYAALKPGGVLGVVEHRAPAGSGMEVMRTTGYVTEDYVKELAARAGFEFVDSAEINANPKDGTVYPQGVWTLPPTLRLGEQDKEKYLAIGESDRMTLKFRKPQ